MPAQDMPAENTFPSSGPVPGFRRGPRIADLMTRDYYAFATASAAAERAGDAATALEYHQGVPMFRRSAHRVILTQLADLAQEMTPWLWARWAAYQCTRVEDEGSEGASLTQGALDLTVRMFHDEDLAQAYETGGDPMRVLARVAGESWVFHQLCTFELSGLECFLQQSATGLLADRCGLATSWAEARAGGYRVDSTAPGRLVVRDLADDRSIELLDLGARLHADSGGWLLGRVVPSGATPALMFDTRPLAVDRRTATEASSGGRSFAWLFALERAIRDGRVDPAVLLSEDRELVTDVSSLDLLERGTAPSARTSAREALADGRDEIGRAAYRVLRAVADGVFGAADDAPYVAAAAVNAHGYAEARRQLVRPEHRAGWEHWSSLVPEPARGRLLRLAELSSASAA